MKLDKLEDPEKQLVQKLVTSGPTGHLPGRDDVRAAASLRERPTTGTLVRMIHSRVTLHDVGHVYALLMQEHKNDDAKVRALMKQYGWVDMVDPDVTAARDARYADCELSETLQLHTSRRHKALLRCT